DPEATRRQIEDAAASEHGRAAKLIAEAERCIAAIERKRARVEADYLDGSLTAQLWESASSRLDEEARQAAAHAAELHEAAAAVEQEAHDIDAQREVVDRLHALQ